MVLEKSTAEKPGTKKHCLAWEAIKRLEGVTVTEGKNLDAITWQVVESESETDDEIGPDGFCRVKDGSFYTKILGGAFLMMCPGEIWDQ